MTVFQSILLGILQGFTEFLPVSSSGHLVLAKALMHINTGNDISFEVFVHFGTLLSVLVVFRSDIMRILLTLMEAMRHPSQLKQLYQKSEIFRLTVFIIVGCIPAGVLGILFNDIIEDFFTDVKLVSDMLLITGLILFLTRFAKPPENGQVTLKSAIGIGFAQAVAIIPGISRAGSTISAGLMLNVAQENAARFSFLMALPVIFGATLLKVRHLIGNPAPHGQLITLGVGTIVASIAGYLSLGLLLKILRRGKFSLFSYYCFAVGIAGLLFIE